MNTKLKDIAWKELGHPLPICPICGYEYNIGIISDDEFECGVCGCKFVIKNIDKMIKWIEEE